MNFKDAMDTLGLPAGRLAREFGISPQRVRQMRLDPESAGHRPPPEGWETVLARLARVRGRELAALADRLERKGPRSE